MTSDFSSETTCRIFKVLKETATFLYPAKIFFKNEGKLRIFSELQKVNECNIFKHTP
jgi:hypothetical protein